MCTGIISCITGEHVQRSTKQGNPRTARQIEAAFRTALAKGEVGITERKKAPGFKAAMRAFLAWSEQEHKQHPATHRRYQVSSAALLRHFGDQPLDRITPEAVEQFKAAGVESTSRAKEGPAQADRKRIMPATVNRELACLKALFNHAIKSDIPVRNPVSRVGFLAEQNEQTRVLSFDEQARYLAAATPMLRDVATLMLETGMRPGRGLPDSAGERESGGRVPLQSLWQDEGGAATGSFDHCSPERPYPAHGRAGDAFPLPVRHGPGAACTEGQQCP